MGRIFAGVSERAKRSSDSKSFSSILRVFLAMIISVDAYHYI